MSASLTRDTCKAATATRQAISALIGQAMSELLERHPGPRVVAIASRRETREPIRSSAPETSGAGTVAIAAEDNSARPERPG